jgi:hypothetical protein
MRVLAILVLAIVTAVAQTPLVRLINSSHPSSAEFSVGDRFEILILGAPNQPISVRTTTQGRTDWSAVIGSTDNTGKWSTGGQFEKTDFGGWSAVWTIGGKLAGPPIQVSVKAPCLPDGHGFAMQSGPNVSLTCDTSEGRQTFNTPSQTDPFRTPDGRVVNGRAIDQTQEQYHTEILQYFMETGTTPGALVSSRGTIGDETADLISTLIGVNALSDDETRNLLAILRAAFEKPQNLRPSVRIPSSTVRLLRRLADSADKDSLKREINETIAYVQAR